ncbi:hypothetical protein KAFR_0J02320 [Kazachstania africana CBS 2517]|uniref:Uncharacterized protein n=1 Tax=Kazachstania africana (strain ATCC 22294 / BCRC 22015 / CBS 2517 / CECT 1963 / NBRC 1671 / NRRL Y-8276) TaxID=1071382 RepID=H2B0Z6_KAZAF|nr:hypothetical protein KAFR_0J02320 [Kazachstania africana CBS 2517]CCF60296.1 hypothetical protein KAFR_0J02320 [Kazachstania africana CBS 2517]
MNKDGTLLISVKNVRGIENLKPGQYVVLKIGDEVCLRFTGVSAGDEFSVAIDFNYHGTMNLDGTILELFLFERSKFLQSGRRSRHLLESCCYNLDENLIDASDDYSETWKDVILEFNSQIHLKYQVDLKFSSITPFLPLKPKNKRILKYKTQQLNGGRNSDVFVENISTKKHFKFHSIRERLFHRGAQDVHEDPSDDAIIYDLDEMPNVTCDPDYYVEEYKHGITDIGEQQPTVVIKEEDTRLLREQRYFPTNNINMTGYIGKGKWLKDSKTLSESMENWYLQPHIMSVLGPKLPPKRCPRDMLWEEYYLISKYES